MAFHSFCKRIKRSLQLNIKFPLILTPRGTPWSTPSTIAIFQYVYVSILKNTNYKSIINLQHYFMCAFSIFIYKVVEWRVVWQELKTKDTKLLPKMTHLQRERGEISFLTPPCLSFAVLPPVSYPCLPWAELSQSQLAGKSEKSSLQDEPSAMQRRAGEVWRVDQRASRQMSGTCFAGYILDL